MVGRVREVLSLRVLQSHGRDDPVYLTNKTEEISSQMVGGISLSQSTKSGSRVK